MPTFDLVKDTAKVKFILEKRNIPSLTAEVIAVLDISGSTRPLYGEGTIQEALQRIVPVALNFDDNGNIPVYVFNDEDDYSKTVDELDAKNYQEFVRNSILNDGDLPKWGGTDYSPVMEAVVSDLGFTSTQSVAAKATSFFGKLFASKPEPVVVGFTELSKSGMPAIVYIVTDGENSDQDETQALLQKLSEANSQVYFNFIAVGGSSFPFLEQIANDFPNVGYAKIQDLRKVADSDDIYQYLIPTELTDWLRKFVK